MISFSHYISEQKMMSIILVAHILSSPILAMRQFLLTSIIELNEFKKEIYSYKKRSVKGIKISVTYKKFRGKRLSAIHIHQSHHFHWDFSSSQSKLHFPCVLKFPIQFPKRGMNLSIRLEAFSTDSILIPIILIMAFTQFWFLLLNLPNHPHKE